MGECLFAHPGDRALARCPTLATIKPSRRWGTQFCRECRSGPPSQEPRTWQSCRTQVLEQAGGRLRIVVGDVNGKGLRAAMTGAVAIGSLRTFAGENLSPGALLARLNRQIKAAQDGGFVTCLCARITPEGRSPWRTPAI